MMERTRYLPAALYLCALLTACLAQTASAAPSIESVILDPSIPAPGDEVTVELINTTNDVQKVYIQWFGNGSILLAGWDVSILPGAYTTEGLSIYVRATPSDGATNGTAVQSTAVVVSAPASGGVDTDGDGIPDDSDIDDDGDMYMDSLELEAKYGTDPKDPASFPPDNDKDRIPDIDDSDDDNDGVLDDQDDFPTDQSAATDTDGDKKPDDWLSGKGPSDSTTGLTNDSIDTDDDNDGMSDDWEDANGFNSLYAGDAAQDEDGDGKTNLQEFQAGTDPNNVPIPDDSSGTDIPLWPVCIVVVVVGAVVLMWMMKSGSWGLFAGKGDEDAGRPSRPGGRAPSARPQRGTVEWDAPSKSRRPPARPNRR